MTEPIPKGWEPWTDTMGRSMLLPSGLKVAQCQFCYRTCTKAKAVKFLARLKTLVERGLLRSMAGHVRGRPCCFKCLKERRLSLDEQQ